MDNDQLKKYNDGRKNIISLYRKKKIINAVLILGIASILIITIILLHSLIDNIAVTLVLSIMIIMTSIIFVRIRIVTLEHTSQTQLRNYEHNEPTFHAEFKRK